MLSTQIFPSQSAETSAQHPTCDKTIGLDHRAQFATANTGGYGTSSKPIARNDEANQFVQL